ncbi:preprotein translocase subunit SecD [Methermicoccus shengliensis]|uniref:Protein-export membrane protein SecD n=1 Tax=Methermicoccus shengliensis TaxID=660064 RepID=A0A832RXG3_9EURY|nr:preprotein translocase subunit SecD [Methermicoccus shengliensis]KUK04419.1 MAG: Protein-export membrane protein SecD [Euryarchaeota archaeon 55_53]MDI3488101.1 preprotein translocase subunit SecD [Methanosarcinales archaeon]MDN5295700.1 preprotein translocase subunit SecD [Methanosarcinales archaeon]HIH70166.1 preprotein translocase subunit SecD [Methermicoccus shengliensis]
MRRDHPLRDMRVLLLIAALLISLFAIHPHVGDDGRLATNLKYGLDLAGGSTLQLQVEGVVVGIDASRDQMVSYIVSNITSSEPTIVNSADATVVLRAISSLPPSQIESELRAYGLDATVSGSGTSRIITVNADAPTVIAAYLTQTTKSEVVPFKEGDEIRYEIRKLYTLEELNALLAPAGARIATVNGNYVYRVGVTKPTIELTKRVLDEKLNGLGLKDITIRTVGTQYILVDMAGEENLTRAERIATTPGKFEVKFLLDDDRYVFVLDGSDIESVGQVRDDPQMGWGVDFRIDRDAADRLRNIAIEYGILDDPEAHPLVMFLDDREVFNGTLSPGLVETLRLEAVRSLTATTGAGGEEAARELQIHLRVGALPVKVSVLGAGQVPASLGEQFRIQAVIAGLLALLAVSAAVYFRYRQKKILLPMLGTSLSELIMILGFTALINRQLDLAAIGGIIVAIGTGVDHLVIITDEVLYEGRMPSTKVYLTRLGKAFSIIFMAAATTIIAMSSLFLIAFGALKGFALTTIIGVLVGVLIARPAYGRIIKDLIR